VVRTGVEKMVGNHASDKRGVQGGGASEAAVIRGETPSPGLTSHGGLGAENEPFVGALAPGIVHGPVRIEEAKMSLGRFAEGRFEFGERSISKLQVDGESTERGINGARDVDGQERAVGRASEVSDDEAVSEMTERDFGVPAGLFVKGLFFEDNPGEFESGDGSDEVVDTTAVFSYVQRNPRCGTPDGEKIFHADGTGHQVFFEDSIGISEGEQGENRRCTPLSAGFVVPPAALALAAEGEASGLAEGVEVGSVGSALVHEGERESGFATPAVDEAATRAEKAACMIGEDFRRNLMTHNAFDKLDKEFRQGAGWV